MTLSVTVNPTFSTGMVDKAIPTFSTGMVDKAIPTFSTGMVEKRSGGLAAIPDRNGRESRSWIEYQTGIGPFFRISLAGARRERARFSTSPVGIGAFFQYLLAARERASAQSNKKLKIVCLIRARFKLGAQTLMGSVGWLP